MKKIVKNTICLSLSAFLLAACGGGGGSGSSGSPTPSDTSATSAVASFEDCLTLTKGVKYEMSDGAKFSVEDELFNGKMLLGHAERRANGTRFGTNFSKIEGGFLQYLGYNDYDFNGLPSSTNVASSSARTPTDMKPGQTIQSSYTITETPVDPARQVTTSTVTETVTFVGFETLTLGERKFENTCKFISTYDRTGVHNTGSIGASWVAKGFGYIKSEERDVNGVLIPNSSVTLKRIIAAP
jgi:hypothetical protein